VEQLEKLVACRFYVDLKLVGSSETTDATFLECKGIKASQPAIKVTEVCGDRWGAAPYGRVEETKIPGNLNISDIVLRRCISASDAFAEWFQSTHDWKWRDNRRDGFLKIMNQSGQPQAVFYFDRAWPTEFSITDASAKSTDFVIEELKLAVENLIMFDKQKSATFASTNFSASASMSMGVSASASASFA
jgi:phage tail-like protein